MEPRKCLDFFFLNKFEALPLMRFDDCLVSVSDNRLFALNQEVPGVEENENANVKEVEGK